VTPDNPNVVNNEFPSLSKIAVTTAFEFTKKPRHWPVLADVLEINFDPVYPALNALPEMLIFVKRLNG